MVNVALQRLVERYCRSSQESLRIEIIHKSFPLIRNILGRIRRPRHPLLQDEDLESVAVLGLLQALDAYTPSKKVLFGTFAYFRIHGAVVDYLRDVDQVSRPKRRLYGRGLIAADRLAQRLGREPEDFEVSEEIGMEVEEYQNLLKDVWQRSVLSLDSAQTEDGRNLHEVVSDADNPLPDHRMAKEPIIMRLLNKVDDLPDRERQAVLLYFFEDLTLKDVGDQLGLSEARTSQIVAAAVSRIREALSKE